MEVSMSESNLSDNNLSDYSLSDYNKQLLKYKRAMLSDRAKELRQELEKVEEELMFTQKALDKGSE